jgi:hypothetical protein
MAARTNGTRTRRAPSPARMAKRGDVRLRFPTDDVPDHDTLQPGESLDVEVEGLRSVRSYDLRVQLVGNGDASFTARLLTDGDGRITRTTLWPQVGLEELKGRKRFSLDEAIRRCRGRAVTVTLLEERRAVAQRTLEFSEQLVRPLLVGTDERGFVQNWLQAGSDASANVTVLAVPFRGRARVFLVPRQRDWRAGDLFAPVTLASGRAAWADAQVDERRRLTARVCTAAELLPGAYDFVVRELRYGYEDDEYFRIRREDIVSRRFTGLVVRGDFMRSKAVRGGCANTMPISGRRVGGAPYFDYADTFQVGEDIWGALDPLALSPTLVGKMVALYVIQHKTAAQWTADASLTHLGLLGGNAAVHKIKTVSGCINYDEVLLWPNASQVGEYDVVADFGNDTADPGLFVPNAQFDMPNDICDGYFVAGFRVVTDPTVATQFANAGTFTYDDGPVTVTDEFQSLSVARKGVVYFPSDVAGATTAAQISTAQASYPMLIAVHGNSGFTNSYRGYDYLLEHWAKNGFIAASIHCEPGMAATGRARLLFEHIARLQLKFGAIAQNTIGIMGHSRGGEAVAAALRINHDEALGHNFIGVVCLSPSDWILHETIQPQWAAPLQVIYGSLDGDIAGGPPLPMETGFAIYDRASGAVKSMVFAYGAIHDRFNTVWGDGDLSSWQIGGTDASKAISADTHQKLALGYMTAFFRRHAFNETQWDGVFTGEWRPAAVDAAEGGMLKTYHQYSGANRREIDAFEGAHSPTSWQTSTIGAGVTDDATLPMQPTEDNLWTVDVNSPHSTAGLLCQWNNLTDHLRFDVPVGQRDVSAFQAVSLRVTQKNGSASNPAGLSQDLYVTLKSGNGNARSIRAAAFDEIPYPFQRFHPEFTKSAMRTVRIPLTSYTIAVINTVPVDLTNIVSVTVDFSARTMGEVEVDSIEFSS